MTEVATTPRRRMSTMQRLKIWEKRKGICLLCRRKIDGAREDWIVEHPRALGLGGADDESNMALAHEGCRRLKDKDDIPRIAKAKRQKAKHIRAHRRAGPPMPGSRASRWKRKIDGTTVRRDAR